MLDVVLEGPIHGKCCLLFRVSILVVLDVVLEATQFAVTGTIEQRFNPCCAGCSSGSVGPACRLIAVQSVSILVVLDVVLEDIPLSVCRKFLSCFNPCCAGCSSGRLLPI